MEFFVGFFWLLVFILLSPVLLVWWLLHLLWPALFPKPTLSQQETERTQELVEQATGSLQAVTIPTFEQFWQQTLEALDITTGRSEEDYPTLEVIKALRQTASVLYMMEGFDDTVEPPLVLDGIEGARYRDRLRARLEKTTEANVALARDAVTESLQAYINALPSFAFKPFDEVKEDIKRGSSAGFLIPTTVAVPNVGRVIYDLMLPLMQPAAIEARLFRQVRLLYDRNVHEMSSVAYPPRPNTHPRLTQPSDHKGTPAEIADGYLKSLPFQKLFETSIPFQIPYHTRFEHTWLVSPPGTGKSTTLSVFIHADLELVSRGEASVIVMESNRDLIKSIEGLKRFAPGGDLAGRLIVIDVEDVEYPIAINLFDVGLEQINRASPRDREALLNSAVSLLDYVFRALLGAELTSRQSTLFNFTIQLLIQIPNATLDTLIDLMQPNAVYKYAQYIDALDADSKQFFKLKFAAKEFEQTKSQVTDRIFAIKRIRALSRMFAAPKTKLSLYDEMAKGRVILINAAKSLLQEEGVEVFGRFFLAMILLAAEKRQLLSKEERMPTFVYIDECHDIIRRDEKIPIILDQARKFQVGMVLAHQRLDQMTAPVLSALYGSTVTKFATQLSDANASAMARNMGTTPEFIASQPAFHYAASTRGYTKGAVSICIPFVDLNRMERMTDAEAAAVREEMRRRYAILPEVPEDEDEDIKVEDVVAEPSAEVISPGQPQSRPNQPKTPQDIEIEVLSLTGPPKTRRPSDRKSLTRPKPDTPSSDW